MLPPKKVDIEPRPAVVDEVDFEESDIVEVRSGSFPAGPSFFDHGFPSQFGSREEDWEDEDGEEYGGGQPECNPQ